MAADATLPENAYRARAERGEVQIGTWITMIRTPSILTLLQAAGLDYARLDMPMPQVNSYVPGRTGVNCTGVTWCAGRKVRMPKSGTTTSSVQPELSRRSNSSRTGRPASTVTTDGV